MRLNKIIFHVFDYGLIMLSVFLLINATKQVGLDKILINYFLSYVLYGFWKYVNRLDIKND